MARKKRPGGGGVGGRKANFSPPNTTRLGEIVEEIVVHLEPWKRRKALVTSRVNRDLKLLLLLAPLEAKRCDRTQNRIHAQQLDGALHKIETLLASAPLPLKLFLLNPLPGTTDGGMPAKTPAVENIERTNRQRADSFAAELKRLRQVCARGVDPGFGFHPNYDPASKHFCAFFAHALIKGLSDGAITGTAEHAFRAIAGLAYEAISGKRDADLKRACDTCLARSGEHLG
jgi:hypothetical protein